MNLIGCVLARTRQVTRYPKAGDPNPNARLGVASIAGEGKVRRVFVRLHACVCLFLSLSGRGRGTGVVAISNGRCYILGTCRLGVPTVIWVGGKRPPIGASRILENIEITFLFLMVYEPRSGSLPICLPTSRKISYW